jgi:hypothetical protein
VAVLTLVLGGIATITAHLRCIDAAREAARLIARGDPGLAREAVTRIAPDGAGFRVEVNGDQIEVEVSSDRVGNLLTVSGKAFAVAEPQEAG